MCHVSKTKYICACCLVGIITVYMTMIPKLIIQTIFTNIHFPEIPSLPELPRLPEIPNFHNLPRLPEIPDFRELPMKASVDAKP